jgi:hypothetical protein
LTEIGHKKILQAAYRPYIECPPIRGNTARCLPRFFWVFSNAINSINKVIVEVMLRTRTEYLTKYRIFEDNASMRNYIVSGGYNEP